MKFICAKPPLKLCFKPFLLKFVYKAKTMKRFILLSLYSVIYLSVNAQQTHKITAAGFAFSPLVLDVLKGDIVNFDVTSAHPVLQVSESTWNADGSTALP